MGELGGVHVTIGDSDAKVGALDAAKNPEHDRRADAFLGQQPVQIVEARHRWSSSVHDDVAVAEAGGARRAIRLDRITSTPDACARWWKRDHAAQERDIWPATPR